MTLIDTNVLLDLATDDPVWADWSAPNTVHLAISSYSPLGLNAPV
jgi:predicted nucleic acid-binding protein